ncbi:MAG: tartrate dehydrogenase [Candidatus Parvarchaeota archaeon]|nr:tartrate dehydrogenase [Candidatus Jingweiarchaeum tengchongense]
MKKYKIAVLPGDGIGKEIIGEGVKVIEMASELSNSFKIDYTNLPWSCELYKETKKMMPDDGLKILADHDVIYLGAIGFPGVPDHVSLWGLLLPIRFEFDQYINLRPVKLLNGVTGPLRKTPKDLDFVVIRENTEGEYAGSGGRLYKGTPSEVAIQTAIFTRKGTERVIRYAFDLARKRRKNLTSITKSNALNYSMVFWDEVFEEISKDYPDVNSKHMHVDAAAANFILHPEYFDVVVASNLFGDILTDLGAAIQGGIGMAPGGNINPERKHPSMFEPIGGSAPDIAGKGIANPIGAIWAASMMLDFLGESESAQLIFNAICKVVEEGKYLTPDIGGNSTTQEVGAAIREKMKEMSN